MSSWKKDLKYNLANSYELDEVLGDLSTKVSKQRVIDFICKQIEPIYKEMEEAVQNDTCECDNRYNEGYDDGYDEGYDEGYDAGFLEAKTSFDKKDKE
jgi:flagellar biosynthesis/type III secretory pathway protein FliH